MRSTTSIIAAKLGKDPVAKSHNGNIEVKEAHESAIVQSNKGNVLKNSIEQPKEKPPEVNLGRVSVITQNTPTGTITETTYHDEINVPGDFSI